MSDMQEPDGKKPLPKCKAILLCDQIIMDAMTGKRSLIGIFASFNLPTCPHPLPPFWAFLQLHDGIGRYNLVAEVHDLRENKVIASLPPLVVEFPERTNRLELSLFFQGLRLQHDGMYDFVVFADGREIDRQQFLVRLPGSQSDEPDNQPDADGSGE